MAEANNNNNNIPKGLVSTNGDTSHVIDILSDVGDKKSIGWAGNRLPACWTFWLNKWSIIMFPQNLWKLC
jgi:hypothetical protein